MPREPDVAVDYVLPLRWADDGDLSELTAYLRHLRTTVSRVVVVDGSPEPLFAAHRRAWSGLVEHVRPDPDVVVTNGKVAGVLTGLRRCRAEHVVVADDDVRWTPVALAEVSDRLRRCDLVAPQNVFQPLPWHAWWDTGRTLLNRALGADYPGTVALRRSTFRRVGGYCGDVLFENLELMRTFRAAGAEVHRPLDLYVPRRPPTAEHFLGQRVRQAYDDLAQPGRLAVELTLAPVVVALGRKHRAALLAGVGLVLALAERGRRRAGGREWFPATTTFAAPLWLVERAVCVWIAVAARARGGVRYGDGRLRRAAHSERALRRRPAQGGGRATPAVRL